MTEEMMLCNSCNGKGFNIYSELVDYHNRIYEDDKQSCSKCNGTGRLIKIVTVQYVPYSEE